MFIIACFFLQIFSGLCQFWVFKPLQLALWWMNESVKATVFVMPTYFPCSSILHLCLTEHFKVLLFDFSQLRIMYFDLFLKRVLGWGGLLWKPHSSYLCCSDTVYLEWVPSCLASPSSAGRLQAFICCFFRGLRSSLYFVFEYFFKTRKVKVGCTL